MTNTEISVGRRKSSIARVRFVKGKGKIVINNQDPLQYFKRESYETNDKPIRFVHTSKSCINIEHLNGTKPNKQKLYCKGTRTQLTENQIELNNI